jgi:hypothetical protein
MKYAGIDEATPDLARDSARFGLDGRPGWRQDLNARIGLAAALGAAAVGVVLWLARSGQDRIDRTRAGGHLNIVRCPEHGIAYDAELEECTECAKTAPARAARPRHLSAVPASPAEPGLGPFPKPVQ